MAVTHTKENKNMKTKLSIKITSLLLAFSFAAAPTAFVITSGVVGSGCTTATGTVDPATINATAVVLRGAARDGAVIAIQNDAANRKYFELATGVIGTFLTGKDYTPGALQTALMKLDIPQLNNQWVQIGLGTVIDLYQLYYGQYVKSTVNGNEAAAAFLTAVQDGFNQALGNPVVSPPTPLLGASRPVGAITGAPPVLPRPISK